MRLPKVKELTTTIYTTSDGKVWNASQKEEADHHQLVLNIETLREKVINTIINFFSDFDENTRRDINGVLRENKFQGDLYPDKLRALARLLVDMFICMPRLSGLTQFEYIASQVANDLEDIKDMHYKLAMSQTSK